MKTMRVKYILGAVALVLAICSCDRSEFTIYEGKRSSKSILIGKVEVVSPLTKSDNQESSKVGEINDGNVSFTVTETVSSIEPDYQTKATATTTANLGSFKVYGYLDPEIKDKPGADDADKNNLYFIQGAEVGKNSIQNSKWWGDFSGDDYNWRYGVHHHFWATPNNLSLSINQDTFNSASFSYTSDGTEDVVIAYSKQYFGKDEETAQKDSTLHLTFKHALAAVKINSENLVFKKRDPQTPNDSSNDQLVGNWPTTSTTPRCEVVQYELKGLKDKGGCSVDSSTVFTWSNLSSSKNPATFDLLANNEQQFLIPQSKGTLLHLQILDRQRDLSLPFIYEAETVLGSGVWQAGHQYNYNFQGQVIVPDQGDKEGINADFAGKPFQSLCVIQSLGIKYIKKVRLSWTNYIEMSGATGTNLSVGWEYGSVSPSKADYVAGNSFIIDNSNLSWAFKDGSVLKGNGTPISTSTGVYQFDSYVDILFPASTTYDSVGIWCSYMGSDGGHSIVWNMSNMKCEILEWR